MKKSDGSPQNGIETRARRDFFHTAGDVQKGCFEF
jgi:hypothetical protein